MTLQNYHFKLVFHKFQQPFWWSISEALPAGCNGWKGVFCSRSVFQFMADKSQSYIYLNTMSEHLFLKYLWVVQGQEKDLRAFHSSDCCHHWEIHRERRIWREYTYQSKVTQWKNTFILSLYYTLYQKSPQIFKLKHTREELLGGRAQLNLLVDLVGEVRLLPSLSAGAQSCLQRHSLHVLWQLQDLQDINRIGCKETRNSMTERTGGSDDQLLSCHSLGGSTHRCFKGC